MGDDDGQGVLMFGSNVNELDVEAIDLGHEHRQIGREWHLLGCQNITIAIRPALCGNTPATFPSYLADRGAQKQRQ